MISEQFFETKTGNYLEQIVKMCNIFIEWHQSNPDHFEEENHFEYVDAYAALESYLLMTGFEFEQLVFSSNLAKNIKDIASFFFDVKRVFETKYNEQLTEETIATA